MAFTPFSTGIDELLATEINYPHVNGIPELRQNIARLYNGAGVENVLVTVGAAEANHIIMQTMMEPGDELLTVTPLPHFLYCRGPGGRWTKMISRPK